MGRHFVLAGGPGVGKTTVLNEMGKLGYHIIREIAAELIQEISDGSVENLSKEQRDAFRERVVKYYVEEEDKIGDSAICFQDRSIVDTIAYCEYEKRAVPEWVLKVLSSRKRYDGIFFLSPIAKYERTRIRNFSKEEARRLHFITLRTYKDFGYWIHDIPEMPVIARVENIRKRIRSSVLSNR